MKTELDHQKPRFETSVDVQTLAKRLARAQPDELIPYKELCAMVGVDITRRNAWMLSSARRLVQRDHSLVFGAVRGEGIKRLTNSAVALSGEATVNTIHKAAKRGARRVACANYDTLSETEKVQSNAHLSLFGALAQVTKRQSVKRLADAVAGAQEKLPTGRVLELFRQ